MSYDYQQQRPKLFSEIGVSALLAVRDKAKRLIGEAGCVQSGALMPGEFDAWLCMAAMDFLVERRELARVTPKGSTAGQHEIFTAGPRFER